jgi:hypothetical protein
LTAGEASLPLTPLAVKARTDRLPTPDDAERLVPVVHHERRPPPIGRSDCGPTGANADRHLRPLSESLNVWYHRVRLNLNVLPRAPHLRRPEWVGDGCD